MTSSLARLPPTSSSLSDRRCVTQVNVTIELDERLFQETNAKLDAVLESNALILDSLQQVRDNQAEMALETAEFSLEEQQVMGEVEQLTTVTDSLVTWSQAQTTALSDVRAELAARGVSDADLASLDEVITTTESNVGRLAGLMTTNTDAEGEVPQNPVPEPGPAAPTNGGTGMPTDGSTDV
jgi:hypothetical protein